ncbi:MAG TPA: ABC-2 family transporter protein [Chloroflexota bacterium]|jgi:ABC-2 type transport system permease protein|nr:ABC-2 family transporter protein [Chloroflexota bacterium]
MSAFQRYFRIYLAFVRSCLIREMAFRGHFLLLAFSNTAWTLLSLAFAGFLFTNVRSVGGWDLNAMIVLTGTFSLVLGLLDGLFETNMSRLSEQINRGELDYVLIKPMSSQFYVSTRYVNFNELPAVLISLVTVSAGMARLDRIPSVADLLVYALLVVCALFTFYGLWFSSVTLALWTGRINNIAYLILPIADLGRMPSDIYRGVFKVVFTFILPVALISTIPARSLLGAFEPWMLLYALCAAAVAVMFSSWFWRFSLGRYTSASS